MGLIINFLLTDVHQQYADRQDEISKAFTSKTALQAYQKELKEKYKTIVGQLPEKTALNAKVLGSAQQDGLVQG